jgi:hypothetical protein
LALKTATRKALTPSFFRRRIPVLEFSPRLRFFTRRAVAGLVEIAATDEITATNDDDTALVLEQTVSALG